MSREDQTPEGCRNDFLSMSQETWDAMMNASRGGAFLTPVEQQGLSMAITEKIRRKQESFERGPNCPDCGSAATTVYPMGEGLATLYCDTCKREEPWRPNEECGSCGADIGPSATFPWHGESEDCRAIRDPLKGEIT